MNSENQVTISVTQSKDSGPLTCFLFMVIAVYAILPSNQTLFKYSSYSLFLSTQSLYPLLQYVKTVMVEKKLIHITVDENNYERLKKLGQTGDSFNDVITKILDRLGVKA